jgi:DNA-binding NtrC family response regulator
MSSSGTPPPALAPIVGQDPALLSVLKRLERVAPTRAPVLVTGESGTGKELVARALHQLGPAPEGPFVVVNCGALSRELAESELFGHERGAFTGAGGRRAGWFEEADGGTLVLDEVGELPLGLQPKLLRVLETGRVRRVGGVGETAVRVRIVALTLRDLRAEARRGAFRHDLFHRLAAFELHLPPLRHRLSDLPALARRLLAELEPEVGRRRIDPLAVERLGRHAWPGNVRELRNVLRRAAVLSEDVIGPEHVEIGDETLEAGRPAHAADGPAFADERDLVSRGIADEPWRPFEGCPEAAPAPAPAAFARGPAAGGDVLPLAGRTFRELEAEIFTWALRRHGGSRRQAARSLSISRSTFCDRVKRLGIV